MAKLRLGEKRVQLSFQRPEDLRLYAFMEKESYRCRWDISTFIVASLTEAFKEKMEEYEVEAIAAEAAQKVRERTAPKLEPEPEPKPVVIHNPTPEPIFVSMEDAAKQAEAQIAQLDAMASTMMAKRLSARKGVGVPPPPPPLPTSSKKSAKG